MPVVKRSLPKIVRARIDTGLATLTMPNKDRRNTRVIDQIASPFMQANSAKVRLVTKSLKSIEPILEVN